MNKLTIVCARYNEDIHWMNNLIKNQNVIVYNKGNDNLKYIPQDKIIKCENLGREGGTYIKHILDNYDNLSDYTIFLQADPVDHIYCNEPIKSYNRILSIIKETKNYNFKYISTHFISVNKNEITDYTSGIPSTPIDFIAKPIKIIKIINYLNFIKQNLIKPNTDISLFSISTTFP